ncbi:MAG: hypothetical protein ABIL20_08510, partial [candidate division WOR-3 bacterium]
SIHLIIRLAEICLSLDKRKEALLYLKRALHINPFHEKARELLSRNFTEDELKDVVFPIKPEPFWHDMKKFFAFPFHYPGITRLFIYSLVGMFFISVPIFGTFLILIFYLPLVSVYSCFVLQSAMCGKMPSAEFPSFSDVWEDILRPFILTLISLITSFLPLILYRLFALYLRVRLSVLIPIGLVTGVIFFPMSLTITAHLERFATPLRFSTIIISIFKTGYYYLLMVGAFICIIVLELLIASFLPAIPLINPLIFWFATLYLLTLLMYVWGNIYEIRFSPALH